MKKIILALCLCVLVFAQCNEAYAIFFDGNKLLEYWQSYKTLAIEVSPHSTMKTVSYSNLFLGYVSGVADTGNEDYFSIPQTVTIGQLCEIVGQFLEKEPDLQAYNGAVLVMMALKEVFPKTEPQEE